MATISSPRFAFAAILLLALAGLLAPSTGAAQDMVIRPPAAKPAESKTVVTRDGFRVITWDDLMPADWDPMKDFKDANLGIFSDADPRAAALMKKMREAWDKAPVNNAMDGTRIRIPGYVVPLEESKAGLKEFLLVPYFGACIHTPPPPANQIIHINRATPVKGIRSMDPVWVSGTLKTLRSDTFMGATGYRLEAVSVEIYSEPPGDTKR